MPDPKTEAPDQSDEKRALEEMLQEARVLVAKLERALGRLDAGEEPDHPVRYWRKQRRMGQSELARAVGVTPAAICRIEHSDGIAGRPATRAKIAEVLDIPPEWLDRPAAKTS